MNCIFCAGETRVTNSRPQKRTNSVWRRRECSDCGVIFTSTEGLDLSGSIVVRKQKRVEPFSRDKLFLSINDSVQHRKSSLEDAGALTDTITRRILSALTQSELNRNQLVEVTCAVLERFDKAAAVQYRAFHPLD